MVYAKTVFVFLFSVHCNKLDIMVDSKVVDKRIGHPWCGDSLVHNAIPNIQN